MALGTKLVEVETKGTYTLEEFFESIRTHSFEAGKPSYIMYGNGFVIAFPTESSRNQVWIMSTEYDRPGNVFYVVKSFQQADMQANAIGAIGGSTLTGDGSRGLASEMGDDVKECERLILATALEIEEMGL